MREVIDIMQVIFLSIASVCFAVTFLRMLLMRPMGLQDGGPTRKWVVHTLGMAVASAWCLRDIYVLEITGTISQWGALVRFVILGWAASELVTSFDPSRVWVSARSRRAADALRQDARGTEQDVRSRELSKRGEAMDVRGTAQDARGRSLDRRQRAKEKGAD